MDLNVCRKALPEFARKRVLVIGDLMLDEHIWGNVSRISPEAPVMVVNADSTTSMPGGAANVANNLRALGAEALVVGVVGDDASGRKLVSALRESGADVSGIFVDKERPTIRKSRIWASHRHQVVRVDWEDRQRISSDIVSQMVDFLETHADEVDAILLSDYDKGVVIDETVRAAITITTERNKISISNAKPRNLSSFGGINLITMNRYEAGEASGMEIRRPSDAEEAGRRILASTSCRGLVVTTGGQGLSALSEDGTVCHVPAVKSEVYDEAGAGDTVVSALTLAISTGLGLAEAGAIANCAGGAVVRKVGVATTTIGEIDGLLVSCWDQLTSQ